MLLEMKRIFSFFTTWVFILFVALITFRKNFNARHEKMIICMTLSCSILGFYIVRRYYDKIPDEYKNIVNITDIICHILPLVYILFFIKKRYVSNRIEMFLWPLLFGLYYSMFYKPSKVYNITGWSDQDLITTIYSLYMVILIFYKKNIV
jgi:hypothetical protein